MPKKKSSLNNVVETNNGIRISYHEKVCAERMKTLFKKIDEMSTDIRELRADMNKGKKRCCKYFSRSCRCTWSNFRLLYI